MKVPKGRLRANAEIRALNFLITVKKTLNALTTNLQTAATKSNSSTELSSQQPSFDLFF